MTGFVRVDDLPPVRLWRGIRLLWQLLELHLKRFTAYATRMDKVVVLYRNNGSHIVISPDDVDAFLAAMREAKRWR